VQRHLSLVLGSALLLLITGCKSTQVVAPPSPEYRPTGTIKDLMDSLVDPNSDYLWESVSTESNAHGVTTKVPKTDEDWENERHHAIALLEATNLLQMPGRRVARPGEKAENPNVEESPEEIQALIDGDRASWIKHARDLYDATAVMMQSIDAKDATGVLNAGEGIDKACENCHAQYWYPHQFDKIQDSGEATQPPSSENKPPKKLEKGDL
jgi:hypothetical protein